MSDREKDTNKIVDFLVLFVQAKKLTVVRELMRLLRALSAHNDISLKRHEKHSELPIQSRLFSNQIAIMNGLSRYSEILFPDRLALKLAPDELRLEVLSFDTELALELVCCHFLLRIFSCCARRIFWLQLRLAVY
jgi:hypothetical protein